MNTRQAYRAGRRTGGWTQRDWSDALEAFTLRHCSHPIATMCPVCRAWCDGFSDLGYHDTERETCHH